MPIVVILLVRFGLVTTDKLKDFRGYFVVLSFVIAAVTPPDVISQLALAVPMCILYELGILGARYMQRNQPPADEEQAASAD